MKAIKVLLRKPFRIYIIYWDFLTIVPLDEKFYVQNDELYTKVQNITLKSNLRTKMYRETLIEFQENTSLVFC